MDDQALRELAEAGAICQGCGGVHTPDIDTAIIGLAAEDVGGRKIPWCRCEDCKLCAPLREAVAAVARESEVDSG